MKITTSLLTVFALLITSVPAALASDIDDSDDADFFNVTGREDLDDWAECRAQMGIEEGKSPVGAQLYNVRRCVNKRESARRQSMEATRMRFRSAIREEAAKKKLSELRARRSRRLLIDRVKKREQQIAQQRDRRRDATSVREKIRMLRADRRKSIEMSEEERTQAVHDRATLRRAVREACDDTLGQERAECIRMQLHNYNLSK